MIKKEDKHMDNSTALALILTGITLSLLVIGGKIYKHIKIERLKEELAAVTKQLEVVLSMVPVAMGTELIKGGYLPELVKLNGDGLSVGLTNIGVWLRFKMEPNQISITANCEDDSQDITQYDETIQNLIAPLQTLEVADPDKFCKAFDAITKNLIAYSLMNRLNTLNK